MKHVMAVAGVGLAIATGMLPVGAAAKNASVKILNRSDWTIEQFYLSPTDEGHWGPDQLKDEVIEPGESFTLHDIPCDDWDVKLVDEDGDVCVVPDVDLCKTKETWEITSRDLLKCQADSE